MPASSGPTTPPFGSPGYGAPGTRSPTRTTKSSSFPSVSKKRSNRKGGRK